MDLENLRRQAEQLLGKETVDEIERRITKTESGDVDYRQLVDVRSANFPKENRRTSPANATHSTESLQSGESQEQLTHMESADIGNRELVSASGAGLSKNNHPAPPAQTAQPKNSQPSETGQSAPERIITSAIRGEFAYGMLGLILGLSSIVGGIILGLHGVTGSTSWTAKLFGLQSQINDAAPGVVLFIVGIFFVVATRPKVKLRDLNQRE